LVSEERFDMKNCGLVREMEWAWCLVSEERFDVKNCGLVREMEWAWCLVPTAAWSERWSGPGAW